MYSPILSQEGDEILCKKIEEIRNRLISLEARQAQLNSNPIMSTTQKAKPLIIPFDPLYDQLDLSWVNYKVESMPT